MMDIWGNFKVQLWGKAHMNAILLVVCGYENKCPLKEREQWTGNCQGKQDQWPSILEVLVWGSEGEQ